MRQNVLKFLKNLPASAEDQFNEALLLYMKAETPNPGVVRAHNVQGYSPQRLEELLYDLKQAYNITDTEVLEGAKVIKMDTTTQDDKPPEGMPTFAEGRAGNTERKAFVKANNIETASYKTVDMDAAILAHFKALEASKSIAVTEEEKQAITKEIADKLNAGEVIDEATLTAVQKKLGMTDEAFDDFMMIEVPKAMEVSEDVDDEIEATAFEKLVTVLKTEDDIPNSLVREIFDDAEMSDDAINAVVESAKASAWKDGKKSKPEGDGTETETSGTDVQKNGTNVSKNETKVPKTETPKANSEKK